MSMQFIQLGSSKSEFQTETMIKICSKVALTVTAIGLYSIVILVLIMLTAFTTVCMCVCVYV